MLKNKSGDVTDVNYRAITLSNSITKFFELVVSRFTVSEDKSDAYQFGFRKGQSTALCTYVLRKVIRHYMQRGSYMFTTFIDFNKAFDNVDYWLLFL